MRLLRLIATFVLGYAVAAAPATPTLAGPASAEVGANPRLRVLAISVDGLKPRVINRLGRDGTPHLHRLMRWGASTLNARTVAERTTTLPNHTTMVTGRRVWAARGGHGVNWNSHRPGTTVQEAAGDEVASVFDVAHRRGGTALFTTKRKLSLFERSWPDAVGRFEYKHRRDRALMKAARADLIRRNRVFTFVHFGKPDVVGHRHGWGSWRYRRAVRRIDDLVGALVRAIRNHDSLSRTRVILTADHGGSGTHHSDPTKLAHYRIPFVVWGPGVRAGNLYEMNPDYRNPGRRRMWYAADRQPIRNGDLANLALDLLRMGPVPDSQFNRDQHLDWR